MKANKIHIYCFLFATCGKLQQEILIFFKQWLPSCHINTKIIFSVWLIVALTCLMRSLVFLIMHVCLCSLPDLKRRVGNSCIYAEVKLLWWILCTKFVTSKGSWWCFITFRPSWINTNVCIDFFSFHKLLKLCAVFLQLYNMQYCYLVCPMNF